MKKRGVVLLLIVLTAVLSGAVTASTTVTLFEGYLDKGEAVLVGPLVVALTDTEKDYGNGEYYAFLVVAKDGRLLNAEYKTIYVPDPEKIQELLMNPEFIRAMAETQGYDVAQCEEYVNNSAQFNACLISNAYGFYQWMNTASPGELADAVMRTIEEHPELGISREDILMPITFPEVTPVREGDTVEVNVDNRTVLITVSQVYPNGARISISGPPEWRASTAPGLVVSSVEMPETVEPGETVTVKVHLKNEGALKVRYLNVFVTPAPLSLNESSSIAGAISMAMSQSGLSKSVFYPVGSAVKYIEYLDGKENATLTFKIKINPNTDVGTYPLYVGVVYFTGLGTNMKMAQGYNFVALTVKKPREAFVEITKVETEPEEISPGDTFTVRFEIRNTGDETVKALSLRISSYKVPVQGEVKNVDLSAISQLPIQGSEGLSQSLQDSLNQLMRELAKQDIEAFLPVGEDNVKYVPELMPGESTVLEFKVRANERLENGIYPMRIELEYITEPNEKEITDERLVGIDVTGRAELIVSRVSTSPGRVIPGTENVEVNIQIDNVGTGTAETVVVRPMPGWPFSLSESSTQVIGVGTLRKGDSAEASFRVNVAENASPGTYEIPLLVTYTTGAGIRKNATLRVPVILGSKPNIEVAGVRFEPDPIQGETVRVYVTLRNTGGEKATSVLIEGVVKADQPFTLDKRTDYIGDLAPGATGEGVIILRIDRDAVPKDYNLRLRIRAVGDPNRGDDNVYVFERTITVRVKENTGRSKNLRAAAIITGLVVVVAVLLTYLSERKRTKKTFKHSRDKGKDGWKE
ncbi:hypothetical protein E3E36_04840 [Thermococcus sp. M36]|uniref:COG1361 S-layer family protein n=1 Tax=Thermococcus sp. M36 TaxID=1638261 RepID=UPI0014392316|nr:COG1361 S-layer family protein [Thermococcus sp. M36]NJE05478.1 hypothetical protein [Thermococcus sp. M36]